MKLIYAFISFLMCVLIIFYCLLYYLYTYFQVETDTVTYNCSIDKDYTKAVCRIAELRKNNVVSVYISIIVRPTKLGKYLLT